MPILEMHHVYHFLQIAEELRRVKLWLQVNYREHLLKLENQVEDEILEVLSNHSTFYVRAFIIS